MNKRIAKKVLTDAGANLCGAPYTPPFHLIDRAACKLPAFYGNNTDAREIWCVAGVPHAH